MPETKCKSLQNNIHISRKYYFLIGIISQYIIYGTLDPTLFFATNRLYERSYIYIPPTLTQAQALIPFAHVNTTTQARCRSRHSQPETELGTTLELFPHTAILSPCCPIMLYLLSYYVWLDFSRSHQPVIMDALPYYRTYSVSLTNSIFKRFNLNRTK